MVTMKKGSQQNVKTNTMMPSVRMAFALRNLSRENEAETLRRRGVKISAPVL